ncbi:hypothetical protein AAX26_00559 [Aliarcobacter thereius]|uniref:hypothetical protein n=1 Tax=Aliarcobacter thereius TaxID=544718 RepID=UPI0008276B45|nr:hypothetical protein [Aliarcobacter thereius]OCL87474.1 hypothetical protein AAX26_00559 [Aliarcobacter thereius]
MKNRIQEYFQNINLDIRKTKNARFFDQKVQPDVLSAVCECILNCTENKTIFTVNDIRFCPYSNDLVTEIFNKPDIQKAQNEYDKFFSQPLKMLAYCGLISENKDKKPYKYQVVNKEFIEYISLRDRNAFYFLSMYLEKVLKDSNIWKYFEDFFQKQDKNSLYELRDNYVAFIIENTSITKELEPIRIFNPMLNILSFKYKKLGSKSGEVSVVNYNDLLYNKPNWRDVKKDKSITREEFNTKFFEKEIDNDKFYKYQIEKAKKFIKSIHKCSEIHRFGTYPATQAHHIFLSSQFPEIADIAENIIAITPNQHFYRAHPNNKTALLDKSYQAICLISKLDSIEIDYIEELGNYSKEKFIDIVNIGLEKDFSHTLDFETLKHEILKAYLK